MKLCPCGSALQYSYCCGVYIEGGMPAGSPEALMRSRYSAYTMAKIAYIKKTMRGKALSGFNPGEAKRWARRVEWVGLRVVKVIPETEDQALVEFIARFRDGGVLQSIHEMSEFERVEGVWYYVDGINRMRQ
jgi:SEC-C motif-containing protein